MLVQQKKPIAMYISAMGSSLRNIITLGAVCIDVFVDVFTAIVAKLQGR